MKDLFKRIATLAPESKLLEIVRGCEVRVGQDWYTPSWQEGCANFVLFNSRGEDVCFSDLGVIEEVRWCDSEDEDITAGAATPPEEVSSAALDAVKPK